MVSLLPLVLTAIAIGIAIYIACRQREQFKKLEEIGTQTKDTTAKLKTDIMINKVVTDFFQLREGKSNVQEYKCIFPAKYQNKPLPVIAQGDFYAIHILSYRLGQDKLELKWIVEEQDVDDNLLNGNVIFLCAPTENPALKKRYPFAEIRIGETRNMPNIEWPLEELDIPCWFVNDYTDPRTSEGRPIRKIKVYSTKLLLESPAENFYIDVLRDDNNRSGYKGEPQVDFGIFARLNKDNNRYIIISGIHQYGTWIVADFLSSFLGGEDVSYKEVFQSNKDFVAIIWGEFDSENLKVTAKGVEKNYLWIKSEDKWENIKAEGIKS